jgi:integrase
MASIRARKETGTLFFDFQFKGARCREQTTLPDTPANRKKLGKILERIQAEIALGSFDYRRYFPNSAMAERFDAPANGTTGVAAANIPDTPLFSIFAETWYAEKEVEWSHSHRETVRLTLDTHLLPAFGDKPLGAIDKAAIMAYRAELAKRPGHAGKQLSPSRVNHILNPLRMILREAAERFGIGDPMQTMKSLKVPRTEVDPFTLDEVRLILRTVRADYRPYYTVRFFTGLRTAEIDGLQWQYVDFQRRQILVRETVVRGRIEGTKTPESRREIDMADAVEQALRTQQTLSGTRSKFVFCAANGEPLRHHNVTARVWYPLLRHLGLKRRRPYQTRHTAATLWLAAGENPEWIARQMGHTTTEMLFRVYSRYVPNLTRRDGSAMSRLLAANGFGAASDADGKDHAEDSANTDAETTPQTAEDEDARND